LRSDRRKQLIYCNLAMLVHVWNIFAASGV
jgi:hypothetical protein